MPKTKPVALVTGRAKGIGRAIAYRLLATGWPVGIVDLPGAGLRRTFPPRDRNTVAIEGDIRDEETVGRAVDAVAERFGRLDAVVSNAGIMIRMLTACGANKIRGLTPDSARFHVARVAKNSRLFSTVLIR